MQRPSSTHFHGNAQPRWVAARWSILCLLAASAASAGVVEGKITDGKGDPIEGAYVRLMDKDLNRDDFMGEAFSDSKGEYRIEYSSTERWDDFFGDHPEPYIQVKVSQRDLPNAALLDPDALEWRSHHMLNVDPSGMKVVNLQAKEQCKKRGLRCKGVCSGGCRGGLVLGFGSCPPCEARTPGEAAATSPDELTQLAAVGCAARSE